MGGNGIIVFPGVYDFGGGEYGYVCVGFLWKTIPEKLCVVAKGIFN